MQPHHIRICFKHFGNRRAALPQDMLLQRSVQGFGAIVRIDGHIVQQHRSAVLHGRFLLQGTAQDRDILHALRCFDSQCEFLAIVAAQPEHAVCGILGKCRAPAVCVQQHHAQSAVGNRRQQGGFGIPHPFVKGGRHIRLRNHPPTLCHAQAFQKRCGIHPLKAGIHIRVQQLAGRRQPTRREQFTDVFKCSGAVRAEQLCVPDEDAASLCRFSVAERIRSGLSLGGERRILAEWLCVDCQFPSALQPKRLRVEPFTDMLRPASRQKKGEQQGEKMQSFHGETS